MESKTDKLRMRWAGSEYEIILEKLEMLESWQTDNDDGGVKEEIIDWMLNNKEVTLVEEGEDILDGLEQMMEYGEISGTLLLDSTEIITALIVARNMDVDTEMPTFQQVGNQDSTKRLSRVCRAENMMKVRDEMKRKKELRKSEGSRSVRIEDFQDLEIRRVRRKESSKRM